VIFSRPLPRPASARSPLARLRHRPRGARALLWTLLFGPLAACATLGGGRGPIVATATILGGTGESGIQAITADAQGGLVLAGWYSGGSLGDGTGGNALQPSGVRQGFVLRLDARGNLRWARAIGGGEADTLFALQLTRDGDVLAAGLSHGAGFITRLAGDDGEAHWSTQLPGAGSHLRGLAIDARSDVWAIGSYTGTLAFSFGTLRSEGAQDVIVLNLSGATGAIQSALTFGGEGNEQGRAIAVRRDGSLLIAGEFGAGLPPQRGAINFGLGPLATRGDTDAFLVALSPEGNALWNDTFGGTGNDELQSLALAPDGDVLAVGHTQPSLDYRGQNPHQLPTFQALALRLAPDGSVRWRRESEPAEASMMVLQGALLDAEGNLWSTGNAKGAVAFGSSALAAVSAAGPASTATAAESILTALGADGRVHALAPCGAGERSWGYAIAQANGEWVVAGESSRGGRWSGFLCRASVR